MFETIYSSPTNYTLRKLPSVREQVELCRHIASQLVANDNINSKGANMFFKRVKKAHTWEVPPLDSKEQEMIENIDEDEMRQKLADTLLQSKLNRLSLVLDPRGRTHSLSSLKAEGLKINEHDAVTPDMMSRLMKDLESPEANPKAAELFAKRKAMAQEWELVKEPVVPEPRSENKWPDSLRQEQQQRQVPTVAPAYISSQPMNGWNNDHFRRANNRSTITTRDEGSTTSKRFSLLHPDFFVPTAGSRLSSSSYGSDRIKAPSPWKKHPSASVSCSTMPMTGTPAVAPRVGSEANRCKPFTPSPAPLVLLPLLPPTPTPPPPVSSSSFTRYDDSATTSSSFLLPPLSSNTLSISPAISMDDCHSNAGSNDSNSFSNYTNFFYQTLKHTNPYANCPESILL